VEQALLSNLQMKTKTPPFGSKPVVAETCIAPGTDLNGDFRGRS